MAYLVLLLLLTSCMAAPTIYSKYFYKFGVLLEPDKPVLSYDQYKLIFLRYQLRLPDQKFKGPCERHKEIVDKMINGSAKSKLSVLEGIISANHPLTIEPLCHQYLGLCQKDQGMRTDVKREKRGVPMIVAGGLALIGGIYAGYTGFKNSRDIEWLEEKYNHMSYVQETNSKDLYNLIEHDNDMFTKISGTYNNFKDLLIKESCSRILEGSFEKFLTFETWIDQEVRGLLNMINGEIDPIIVTKDIVEKSLKKNNELSETVFHQQLGLFYQASSSKLVKYNSTSGDFDFIIRVPIIHHSMISPLFNVYNGGWRSGNVVHKLILPKQFYLYSGSKSDNYHAVSVRDTNCKFKENIIICDNSKHFFGSDMMCINALLREEYIDQCESEMKIHQYESEVYKTNCGLIVIGDANVREITSIGSSFHISKKKTHNDSYTKFIKYQDFNALQINDIIVVSNKENYPVELSSTSIDNIPDLSDREAEHIISKFPTLKISEFKNIKSRISDYDIHHYYGSYSLTWIIDIVLIIMIILLIFIIYKLHKKQRRDKSNIEREIMLQTLRR